MKKNIINIMAAAMLLLTTGCSDYLDTTSPSVVDKDFVFSDVESSRAALYYGYQTLQNARSLHSVGYFWTGDLILKMPKTPIAMVTQDVRRKPSILAVLKTTTSMQDKDRRSLDRCITLLRSATH